jgi:hypothetical protein
VESTARQVVLAIQRERRAEVAAQGWKERAAALDGVELAPSLSPLRAMAWVTPTGLAALRAVFDGLLLIEPPIHHHTSAPPAT